MDCRTNIMLKTALHKLFGTHAATYSVGGLKNFYRESLEGQPYTRGKPIGAGADYYSIICRGFLHSFADC